MKAAMLPLVLCLAGTASTAGSADVPTQRLLRFVGEQLAFERIDCPPRDAPPGPACPAGEARHLATYRVVLAIDGEPAAIVEFLAAGWTSHFDSSHHALLYVLASPTGYVLAPELGVSVYPTRDGGWASCDPGPVSEAVEFADDIVFGRTDGLSPYGIAARYPSTDYAVVGQDVHCLRGHHLPALIETLDQEFGRLVDDGDVPGLPEPR